VCKVFHQRAFSYGPLASPHFPVPFFSSDFRTSGRPLHVEQPLRRTLPGRGIGDSALCSITGAVLNGTFVRTKLTFFDFPQRPRTSRCLFLCCFTDCTLAEGQEVFVSVPLHSALLLRSAATIFFGCMDLGCGVRGTRLVYPRLISLSPPIAFGETRHFWQEHFSVSGPPLFSPLFFLFLSFFSSAIRSFSCLLPFPLVVLRGFFPPLPAFSLG